MSYYIYNKSTYKRLKSSRGQLIWTETERGAKAQLTKSGVDKADWEVISATEFYAKEPMVETTNILTGKKVMIRASEKGGCCDPGTETYHSM